MSHGHYTRVTLLYFLLVRSFLSCEGIWSMDESESSGGGGGSVKENEDSVRREMIKVQILQKLGLSEKPIVNNAHKLSKDLALEILKRTDNLQNLPSASTTTDDVSTDLKQSSNATQEDGEHNFARTSEIISFPEKGPILNGHTLLSFSYAGNNAYGLGVKVKKAHLWVKMDYRSSIGRHFGHLLHPKGVSLYVFSIGGHLHQRKIAPVNQTLFLTSQDVTMDLVISRTVMMDSLGWQKLDVTSVVQKWYNKNSRHRLRHGNHHNKNHHRERLTLLIDCAGCANSIHPITFGSHSSDSQQQQQQQQQLDGGEGVESSGQDENNELPFLVLETEASINSRRSRRRALECGPRVKHCCKQRFYVSFSDLHWDDWIIAPKGYYANYCRGHCGGPYRTPDTFLNYHTHVMEEYRRTPEGQSNLEGITPCCAPTKFAPMSLIYFGPDYNIIKRDLPKMIVEECGCP